MTDFSTLPLSPALQPGLDALGYTTHPVQAQSLPAILDGHDVIAQAPTGSGKTAAFGLGLLQAVDPSLIRVQALVLCPTRELADQVGKQIRKLATGIPNLKLLLLVGGVPLGPQLASLEGHDPHVVVGTPGRVQELARKRALNLGAVRTLVLDEADRMLDMGFEEPIREIAGRTHRDRQSLLFSATFPDSIRAMARDLLRDAVEVTVEGADQAPAIRHLFCEVEPAHRQKALAGLLLKYAPESAVVFCNTRKDVDEVANSLQQFGFSALALHGDMEQRDRESAVAAGQPQLQRAGRQRRRRARTGRGRAGGGDQLRTADRRGELPAPRGPYRSRRCQRPGDQPGGRPRRPAPKPSKHSWVSHWTGRRRHWRPRARPSCRRRRCAPCGLTAARPTSCARATSSAH